MVRLDQRIERLTRYSTIAYGGWKEVEEATGFVGPTDRAEPVEMSGYIGIPIQ